MNHTIKGLLMKLIINLLLNETFYFQAGNFYSSVGSEGFLLCNLCAGMSPVCSVLDLAIQVWLILLVCYSITASRLALSFGMQCVISFCRCLFCNF